LLVVQWTSFESLREGGGTSGVTPSQLRAAWLEPVGDLTACVARELAAAGPGARLAVLPDGPQTIPYVG
jgi:lactate racemase